MEFQTWVSYGHRNPPLPESWKKATTRYREADQHGYHSDSEMLFPSIDVLYIRQELNMGPKRQIPQKELQHV
ncbi:unnamed protein product [Caretta caretta]